MRGYTYLTTTKTINDYINGCIELFLKNNLKLFCGLHYSAIFVVVIMQHIMKLIIHV